MIKPEIEIIRVIDWQHVAIKEGEKGVLCQCGKAVIFRTLTKLKQEIVAQCPECGRRIIYG